ncbi:hypothetical protein ACFO1V_03160 [Daeguia caeni]|uniref:Uncharacterized protein n=1 Tax=Daeguia caeni TaxID=439612 RepID=A0ABV9H346_9HYPH
MMEPTEYPVEKVNRLARELSQALDEWMEGEFMAVILPKSRSNGHSVQFGGIDAQKQAIAVMAAQAA